MNQDRATAIHEAAHAVIAEVLGVRVRNATAVGRGYSLGSVAYQVGKDQISAFGVICAAGHAGLKAIDPDCDSTGYETDFKMLQDLAARVAQTDGDMWVRSHNYAHELVRQPRIRYAIEAVADAITAQASKGFGTGSAAIGSVIAQAFDEFDAKQRRPLGAPARKRYSLDGCGPLEELARRDARMAEIGPAKRRAATPAKSPRNRSVGKATAKPTPKRKAARITNAAPGFGSPGGWIASKTFTVVLDGRRETVKAGKSWCRDGHELVRRFPGRWEATEGHPKNPSKTAPTPVGL